METFPKVVGMLVQWKIFPVSKLVKYCTSKQLSLTYEKYKIPKTFYSPIIGIKGMNENTRHKTSNCRSVRFTDHLDTGLRKKCLRKTNAREKDMPEKNAREKECTRKKCPS